MTNPKIETYTVRVETPTGHPQGTGFILTPAIAVTCAHVVDACGSTPGDQIRLTLRTGNTPINAQVLPDGYHQAADVAFLRLSSPLPSNITPATLSTARDGAPIRAFGYPNIGDVDGLFGTGELVGTVTETGQPRLQLRSTQITAGFSGAPVWACPELAEWEESTGQVIGMVTSVAVPDDLARLDDVAFAIPAKTLCDLCPEKLELQPPIAPPEDPLRAQELAYLDNLLTRYNYWLDHYTPLAGIAEVRAAVKDGPRLDLPMPFIPPGFEKLIEHDYGPDTEISREPVDDLRTAVTEHRRIILLGDPGSGKTTTLWRLVYDYAHAAKTDPQAPLPLLASLGAYTGGDSFETYLARHLGPLTPHLYTYLTSGRLILLLDGLNEMPQANYADRVNRIRTVLERYPNGAVIVTCRVLDYTERLKKLQNIQVSPLDETRIRDFLHNYLGQTVGERLFSTIGGTRKSWEKPPPLLEMGRNPYLLLMTAQIYAGAGGELPDNRAHLFAAFVDTLLEREKKRHPAEWVDAERQIHALAALAYAIQSEQEYGTAIDRQWALARLAQAVPDCDPKRLLYLAASTTLLNASDTSGTDDAPVRFYHQLLQEYFAARHVVANVDKDTLPSLLAHAHDDRWRQVILLTASHIANADSFFDHFLHALDSLVENDQKLVAFLSWAARKASTVETNYKPAAIRSYYCFIILASDFDLNYTLDHDSIRNHMKRLRIAQIIEADILRKFALENKIILNETLEDILAFAHVCDFALVTDTARDLTRDLDLDLDYVLARALDIDRALDRAQKLGLNALYQALSALAPPAAGASAKDWSTFANRLQEIMIEHRDIGHNWNFTREQTQRLDRYFYAAELLVQCLNLAVVTDRAAIENRLLLPPTSQGTTP
ncbi:MAG: NACHT domain-containing protein [Chloroflexi bacterium]|nr:NACHT domain-containing protein [Chloroflexota bacterium]